MKLIYKAGDITEAHIVKGLLESNGIPAHVGGFYLQGAIGDLAASNKWGQMKLNSPKLIIINR